MSDTLYCDVYAERLEEAFSRWSGLGETVNNTIKDCEISAKGVDNDSAFCKFWQFFTSFMFHLPALVSSGASRIMPRKTLCVFA